MGTLNWQIYPPSVRHALDTKYTWENHSVFSLAENLSKTDPWLKQTRHRSAACTPAPHQTRSHTDVLILLWLTTSLFTHVLKWCYVVRLLKLPDGEGLICWVTQIYTVPMERLCSFIYGNDARLHLEYGISGHWAVNNLPLDKHGAKQIRNTVQHPKTRLQHLHRCRLNMCD